MTALDTAPPADVLQAIVHADPAPYYAELAATRPFFFDATLGWWVAASAEAVDAVLGSRACRVRPADEPVPKAVAATPTGAFFGRLVRQIDGPDHSTRKAKVMAALGRLDVSALAGQALRHARTALPDAASLDAALDADAHFRVPLATMAQTLLGDHADAPACQADIAAYLAALGPGASAGVVAQADAAVGRLQQRFADSPFAGGDDDSDADIANLAALLAQTYDACAGLLGNCIVALSRHAGLTARLRAQPLAIEPFVREVLRRDAPVQNTRRFVAHDIALLGQPLRAGDKVLVVLAAANVDGTTNPDPLRFDSDRTAPRLWTFGGGTHRCPADALATAIARETVRHLLSLPDVDRWLAGLGEVAYRPSPNARIPRFQA
ncbi:MULTISPECIES: cytochrome P450 [Ralstonia]|jgi:cytochrome P450|uniref:Biotin biosynthesis cytochrome P450 n=3 Tax=Ralstonia TaxID=48736 RepID=A0ABN9JAY0_9RALS|nr:MULTISPECIES: cytochrome P450 [Ralstonia]MBB0026597.1 cytochrome P450 [Ralstonia pickettii]MBB0037385.1 cytochrome P450 [Ralstonia pickettii]MBB0099828.1 cytochrome P450 [Ralstonia pickettii]MBB0109787.1 cytochrome P450 [Ralstonia pickettii]MBB0130699.1 cytochrome P450 [Ralstonia pickettii]